MFNNGIDFDILRNHCTSETVKTFMGIDSKQILIDIQKNISDIPTSFPTIIKNRLEIMGYIDTIDKKYAGYCVATDLNVEYSPKIKLYALANGNTIPVKVSKKLYKENPIFRGDIESDEKEWWISEYQICTEIE